MGQRSRRTTPLAQTPRACHHEQQSADSCVAACVCILRRRHGDVAQEEEIRGVLRPFESLWTAAKAFGWTYECLDWDDPAERQAIMAYLHGTWLMVSVLPGPMTMFVEQLRPSPKSRYGPLMRRASDDVRREEDLRLRYPQLPHHAIVMVAAVTDGFRYLDPYYPGRGQPFFMPQEDFARVWTGEIIIPR